MCWSKHEERRLEEEARRKEEELRRLEAEAEERAAQLLSDTKREEAGEPTRLAGHS